MDPLGGDNTAFIDDATLTKADSIADGSFESPALTAGTYQLDPATSSWVFTGSSGISTDGSDFTAANPGAPDGSQVAIVQDGGSMNQVLQLDAGVYTLSFQAAQRAESQTQKSRSRCLSTVRRSA